VVECHTISEHGMPHCQPLNFCPNFWKGTTKVRIFVVGVHSNLCATMLAPTTVVVYTHSSQIIINHLNGTSSLENIKSYHNVAILW